MYGMALLEGGCAAKCPRWVSALICLLTDAPCHRASESGGPKSTREIKGRALKTKLGMKFSCQELDQCFLIS